jgi:hypothetical protein
MVATLESLTQQLSNLDEEQLIEVAHFIEFLKFRAKRKHLLIDVSQLKLLYSEFAEADRELAESGMEEYADLLKQDDEQ